jgi:hypothetical protein
VEWEVEIDGIGGECGRLEVKEKMVKEGWGYFL